MKKMTLSLATLLILGGSKAQAIDKIITQTEVTRIESTLSSDAMQGRETFTAGNEKAAAFIAEEMKKIGLQPLPGQQDFMQRFSMVKGTVKSATATVNSSSVSQENMLFVSTKPSVSINEKSGYKVIAIKAGEDFMQAFRPYFSSKENVIIFADPSFAPMVKRLQRFLSEARFAQENNVVIVLTGEASPATYKIEMQQQLTEQKLVNAGGMLKGKTKPDEYVIFSGHYDHLGYGKPNDKGDSLYNGANDDASGITAVLMLAKYYKELANNERTIVFAAFTAEEIGGFGSKYFSEQFDPAKVMAMFNIEMIGTESKWGTNSAYITGYEKTDMGKILGKNLAGSKFKFYPDPYTAEQLFYRSDNATLARLGVPAHTISTSKMDNEPHYHQADDTIETLDMKNMTEIIKSVAVSAQSIISGKDTPTRVDTKTLR